MSQDSVEIIEVIHHSRSSKKPNGGHRSEPSNSSKKQNNGYASKPSTSNKNQNRGHGNRATSTPVNSDGEDSLSESSQGITLSQNISKRPNKFFASPTKSPSKKASPVLSKYSPFRKNSPKFKHIPINSYFHRSPEKPTQNSLDKVFQSVKTKVENTETPIKDEEMYKRLLSDDDDYDLSQIEVDADKLSPLIQGAKSAKSTIKLDAAKENLSKDKQPKEMLSNNNDNLDEESDDNVFKAKKMKKKVKKALFPSKSNQKSGCLALASTANSSSLVDSRFEDPAEISEIESSQTNDAKFNKSLVFEHNNFMESSSQNKENREEMEETGENKSPNHSVKLNHTSNHNVDDSPTPGVKKNSLEQQANITNKCSKTVNSDLYEASCSQTHTGISQTVVQSPTKSNMNSQNVEDSGSHSQSSPNYAFADFYSSCVEAALTDCLHYLSKHKERGVFVDLEELGKFTCNGSFHQIRRRLYARMLINRKFKWYRVEDLSSYEKALNINHEGLVRELYHLEEEGFVTSNLDDVDLHTLLNLLQVKDLKRLCKFIKVGDNKPKPELIEQLMNFQKKQPGLNFFSHSTSQSPKNSILMKRTKEILGHCIKLCEGPRHAFLQCLVFATYPYFHGDPSTRLNDYMSRLSKVQRNEISFPSYTVDKTVVFCSDRFFTMYQESLDLKETVFSAVIEKNWENLTEYSKTAYDKFNEILEDDEVTAYVKKLPVFLHRFTAGHVYARVLYTTVKENKKNSDKDLVIKGLNLLLSQNLYLNHRRGSFYEELAGVYQIHLKNNTKALEIILSGLKDPKTNNLLKHPLSARGAMLNRRKTNPVPSELRMEVDKYLINIPDPTCVIIHARCLQGRRGFKQVYISETEDGLEYSSVEELAKSYYKKLGFTQILHDEGATLRALIYACIWDIIYRQPSSLVDHSVFHSPFQEHPLDWRYEEFFSNRKTEILKRLREMEEGNVTRVMEILSEVCNESENVCSVINWNYFSKSRLNLLKDFMSALTVKVFCKLSLHLLQNVHAYGKAFPDLTMWNPIEKRCMFVEVKSPNDHLSHGQKLWLHNLVKMGANAEVCNIQTTGSRKRKLVDTPSCSSSAE